MTAVFQPELSTADFSGTRRSLHIRHRASRLVAHEMELLSE